MGKLNSTFPAYLVFGMLFNVMFYLFNAFGVIHTGPTTDLSSFQGWFSLESFDALLVGGALAGIGLATLLLRQNTYAVYACLLAGLGMLLAPVRDFILTFPNVIKTLLPDAANPLLPDAAGIYPTNPLVIVITLFLAFGAWWFIFSKLIQQDM